MLKYTSFFIGGPKSPGMLYLIQRYFLKISQWYSSTEKHIEELPAKTVAWPSRVAVFFLLPLILILDFIFRGIFYNFYLSTVSGFINCWNLFEFDDEAKITEMPERPLFAKLLGSPFILLGWMLGLLGQVVVNLKTIFESFYLNFNRAYLPSPQAQVQRLNKLFKPNTALAYLFGLIPGFVIGVIILNVRLFLDGLIRGWNDAFYDSKKFKLKKFRNSVMWAAPGNMASWILRIPVAATFLSLRIIISSTIGFMQGLNQGYQGFSVSENKKFLRKNKFAFLGKIIGFSISYLVFSSLSLLGQIIFESWLQIKRTVIFTYQLNFADYYRVSLDSLGLKAVGFPGLLLGLFLGAIESVFIFSIRAAKQLLITWVNFFVLAYQKATLYSLNQDNPEFEFYQIKQNEYERKLGLIFWIFTLGWAFYIITYFLSLVFIVLVETTIRMFYYSFMYFVELAFWDKNVSIVNYPTLASRDVFGLVGSLSGFICGALVAITITCLRFVFESLQGFLWGLSLSYNQDNKTQYQMVLSAFGYGIGRLLKANIFLPINLMLHVYNLVYLDQVQSFEVSSDHRFFLKKIDFLMGVPFGAVLALGFASLFMIFVVSWRIAYESLYSLVDALPFALQFSAYADANRTGTSKYVFGLPGLILAYLPSVLISLFAPFISLYKWSSMWLSTRYENYQGNEEQLVKIKKLYGLLNNLERSFHDNPDLNLNTVANNNAGGKGSFCFIGKILSFNQDSIAEKYMDMVLEKQKTKKDTLLISDFDEVKKTVRQKYSFWNDNYQNQLNHTHQFISKQLN